MLSADAIFIMTYIVLCSIAKLKSVDINKSMKMFICLHRWYGQIQHMMSVNTSQCSISEFLINTTLFSVDGGGWGTDTSGFIGRFISDTAIKGTDAAVS